MNIKIDLARKDRCDGCPCEHSDTEEPAECSLGYWDEGGEYDKYFNHIRPTKCIEENGE
jgi:hypothetical protein